LVAGQNCLLSSSATDWHKGITLKNTQQPDIEVRLNSHHNNQNMCAVALLENVSNQLRITKLVDYFNGHPAMDKA